MDESLVRDRGGTRLAVCRADVYPVVTKGDLKIVEASRSRCLSSRPRDAGRPGYCVGLTCGGARPAARSSVTIWRKRAVLPRRILMPPPVLDRHPCWVGLMKSINIGFDER